MAPPERASRYAPYTEADIQALEARAIQQTGPLVPLLPSLPPARTLPTPPPRPSSPPPFAPNHPDWVCETFVLPAAFPRSFGATVPPSSSARKSDGAKVELGPAIHDLLTKQLHGLEVNVDANDPSTYADQQQLYLSANCYRPATSSRPLGAGLTLMFSHANGFHKEIWEPTMADMLDAWSDDALPIDEIWALDLVNHGDSGILNEDVLGETFNWVDHGRDVLQFLTTRLSSPPRKIVGIGHSVGGAATTYAASSQPSLYASLVLLDPVLPPPTTIRSTIALTSGALTRRGVWEDRKSADAAFLSKPFFTSWDSRVLAKHLEFGLKDVEGGGRALKTTPRSEALVFGEPLAVGSGRAFARLHLIPPTLPMHFIFADRNQSVLNEVQIAEVLAQVPHATHERVAGAAHLLAQSHPKEVGKAIADYLRKIHPNPLKQKGKL